MSSKNNVIDFPNKMNAKKNETPNGLSPTQPTQSTHPTPPSMHDNNVLNFPSSSPKPSKNNQNDSTPKHSEKTANTHRIPVWMTSGTICLMLLAVPLMNQKTKLFKPSSNPSPHRKIASENQKIILHKLLTGQRRIASIGQQPGVKEKFFFHELQSRYKVHWKNKQLEYCIIRDDQEPLILPTIPQLIKNYAELFPPHDMIAKASYFSDEMEAYELHNEQGIQIGIVEAVRDHKGRVLSIYSQ